MKNKRIFLLAVLFLLTALFYSINVYADEFGEGERCLRLEFIDNGFPAAVTVNQNVWNSQDDEFHTNDGNYTIVILAGKKGDDFPDLTTPGGLKDQDNVSVDIRPNASHDPLVIGDEYKITINLTNYGSASGCTFLGGIGLSSGPEPTISMIEHPEITIDISGEELEYHYVASKPEEADVARFKIGINNRVTREDGTFAGADSNGLIPFRFGNVTFKDDIEPPHATGARTTNPITDYEYNYDDSGFVEFCVIGGAADEYTKIEINGVDYSNQAPHTKVEIYEHVIGRASQFCINNVLYSDHYNIVVEGKSLPLEKQVTGFGWNYLSSDRSPDVSPSDEGIFAHGRIEFVKVDYTDIDGTHHIFDNESSYNHTRYHGTGEIYEWVDGLKEYHEEARFESWGEALVPYGAELTIRVVPDRGYQLTSFTTSENGFHATDEVGVYTILVNENNLYDKDAEKFGLQATFTKIGSEVQATSNKVKGGTVDTQEKISNGSIKLAVTDVNISDERKEAFANKASEEGFTVENIFDISLYNSIYKGGLKDKDGNYLSWDQEINNLSKKANIGLELEDDMTGKEFKLVHELHDDKGITGYEFVDVNYDSSTNTMTFEEDNFSNFAIVVKESNQEDLVTVKFDTFGGSEIAPIKINKGSKIEKPQDPTNGDKEFLGWFIDDAFHDEFDFNKNVERDLTLYAKWSSDDDGKTETYTVNDDKGNTIIFKEIPDRGYNLTIIDYLSYSKDQVVEMAGITGEQYDEVFSGIRKVAEKEGTLLSMYEIIVTDQEDNHTINQGPLTIKIKLTNAMKKYNSFKLLYLNDNMSIENTIELKIEGDYLVGTLPHLSQYLLVGNTLSNADNPKTGDTIMTYVIIFTISTLILVGTMVAFKKKYN